jgi:hypothetical protein
MACYRSVQGAPGRDGKADRAGQLWPVTGRASEGGDQLAGRA